jgi:hypothetical protein
MTDPELNKQLFAAYLFGQRVLYASVDVPKIRAADDRTWDLLREIAAGKTTLTGGPAEMLLHTPLSPHHKDAMEGYLARMTPKLIQHDRELAQKILDGAGQG